MQNSNFKVNQYAQNDFKDWESFLVRSEFVSFMFSREFLSYHGNRFNDCSLVVRDKSDNVCAIIAGHGVDTDWYSHQGLSFGSVVFSKTLGINSRFEIIESIRDYLKNLGFFRMIVKTNPYEQLLNCSNIGLFLTPSKIHSITPNVILSKEWWRASSRKERNLKRATNSGVVANESTNFMDYWSDVLEPLLRDRYGTQPVHSRQEILSLAEKFPDNIKLWSVEYEGKCLAGTVTFKHGEIIHCQYFASTEHGREISALDIIVEKIVKSMDEKFLSLGTSADKSSINRSLFQWKSEFGGVSIPHITAEYSLK